MEAFLANWETYAGVIAAFVLLMDRIAKLTPTETDNKWMKSLYKITAVLGVKVRDNEGKKNE